MDLTVQVNRPGGAPVYNRTIGVNPTPTGVDITLPPEANGGGTISKKSAADWGRALLEASGEASAPSTPTTPTTFDKWTLKGDAANGFSLVNPLGVEQKFFAPVTAVIHYA